MVTPSDLLFVEPFGGMAGDMLLAALLDLKDPRFTLLDLQGLAEALVPGEASLSTATVWRGALSGLVLDVQTSESERAPQRLSDPHRRVTPHRHFSDLAQLIDRAPLSPEARRRSRAVLWRIAVAEGRVHGCAPEAIHFHEIGAVDSLIDVCGAALALERLGVARVLATAPLVGSGTVTCAHGEMPVPVPAVAELMRGVPHIIGGGGERLTPTGAALLLEWVERFGEPGAFETERIGYGAGHRDPPTGPPNLLRVQLGRAVTPAAARAIAWKLECNVDDMTGEELGFALQELRAAGALEAWTSSVQMKKDRPGVIVAALCREDAREGLERILFRHSTTLGVRWTRHERTECAREPLELVVLGRRVRAQLRRRAATVATDADLAFEYDDLASLARAEGIALREAELAARRVWERSERASTSPSPDGGTGSGAEDAACTGEGA